MDTVTDNMRNLTEEVKALICELLDDHSEIYRWNEPKSSLFNPTGDYGWRDLQIEGKRVQSLALSKYRHLYALASTLLQDQPSEDLESLAELDRSILGVIEQNESTWSKTKQEERDNAVGNIDAFVRLFDHLFDPNEGGVVIVPDTNALLFNTALESWKFADAPQFTILLSPTVLGELDLLKINHRNEIVRDKAEKLIRQIKEYRRRGSLADGVPLRKGQIRIRSFAHEPRMENSLPWFEASNSDDRLLASTLEVMRSNPRSAVILVSRDINVQNKAEFAMIPFMEPPQCPKT